MSARAEEGALCLVLHAHMPYVEGFGTWPFGEEWLWEAVATVYLPLLALLEQREGAAITLGLTPVLCDQLESMRGEAGERFLAYLSDVKALVHAEDGAALAADGQAEAAAELRRAADDYLRAGAEFERRGGDLLAAFAALGGPELMTSAATHAVLPMLATDAGLRLQLEAGVASHERRFGSWSGAFWLPECAYDPALEPRLAAAGVRAFCVEQTGALGLGSSGHLEPVAVSGGAIAVPVDWATVALVWGAGGYPSAPAYLDSHRRTSLDLCPWANDGAPYRPGAATDQAREHARDFVGRCRSRLQRHRAEHRRPGMVCCALDAELLGHFWYEGPQWLAAVLDEAESQGLATRTLTEAAEASDAVERPIARSSWGTDGDLSTWDSPAVADLAFGARRAELQVAAAAREGSSGALERAARELLAAQSSDWAFLVTRATAGPYPLERIRGHLDGVDAALAAVRDCRAVPEPTLRHLAPQLDLGPLIAP